MSATVKRRKPSSGSSQDALPVAPQLAFPQQWRPLRVVQREAREKTEALWRTLDDLVTGASDFPSTREPFALSAPTTHPRPCGGHCA